MSPVSGGLKLALAALGTAAACAACVPVAGERILAGELAAAAAAFSALPAELETVFAPAPGARRVMTPEELARLAARHGLDPPPFAPVCFERAAAALSREQVSAALSGAVADSAVRIELDDYSRYPLPAGTMEFPRAGLAVPALARPDRAVLWRGRLLAGGGRSYPVWAKVKLSVRREWVEAARALPAGRLLEAADLRAAAGDVFPFAPAAIARIEDAVGKRLRRPLRAGEPVAAHALAEPRAVEPGAAVAVRVAAGGLALAFTAQAETGGRPGEVVLVRNPANGRRFSALVAGANNVIVETARQ